MKPRKSLCAVCQGKLKRKLLNVIISVKDDWCQVDDRRCSVCKVRLSRYPLPINPRRSWPGVRSSTNLYNPLIPHFSGSWLSPVSTIPNSSSFVIRQKSKFGFSLAWIIINHYYQNYISYSNAGIITDITLCRFEAMEMSYKFSNVVPPPG